MVARLLFSSGWQEEKTKKRKKRKEEEPVVSRSINNSARALSIEILDFLIRRVAWLLPSRGRISAVCVPCVRAWPSLFCFAQPTPPSRSRGKKKYIYISCRFAFSFSSFLALKNTQRPTCVRACACVCVRACVCFFSRQPVSHRASPTTPNHVRHSNSDVLFSEYHASKNGSRCVWLIGRKP